MHGTSSTSSSYDEALSNATSNVTLIKPLMIEDLQSVLKKNSLKQMLLFLLALLYED